MAISYNPNWQDLLDQLQSKLRTEFKNALPVYVGASNEKAGTQYLRISPRRSDLIGLMSSSETREFTVDIFYVFQGAQNIRGTSLEHVLRFVSRIEALIHSNQTLTLSTDSTRVVNCRVESCELDSDDDDSSYIVQWEWKGEHTANVS